MLCLLLTLGGVSGEGPLGARRCLQLGGGRRVIPGADVDRSFCLAQNLVHSLLNCIGARSFLEPVLGRLRRDPLPFDRLERLLLQGGRALVRQLVLRIALLCLLVVA